MIRRCEVRGPLNFPAHFEERPLGRVSKDEAASWFETRENALLTMRN
jgi:hypothetical protein